MDIPPIDDDPDDPGNGDDDMSLDIHVTAKNFPRCPFCDSDELTIVDRNTDDPHVTDDVSCDDCGQSWQEVYSASFYAFSKDQIRLLKAQSEGTDDATEQ